MRWPFRRKPEPDFAVDFVGREHLVIVAQAASFSLALFTVLAAASQLYVPGLLTDRVSPSVLAVMALVGLGLGSWGDLTKAGGVARLLPTFVLTAAAAWSVWLYLDFLPYGRSGYTMLVVAGLFLLSWRRPGSNKG